MGFAGLDLAAPEGVELVGGTEEQLEELDVGLADITVAEGVLGTEQHVDGYNDVGGHYEPEYLTMVFRLRCTRSCWGQRGCAQRGAARRWTQQQWRAR